MRDTRVHNHVSFQILSLDDDLHRLKLYHVVLEMHGYQHRYTTNTHNALRTLRQEPIDLFTQDIMRPDMNGFELYWLMKSTRELRDIPMLIISAWGPVEVSQTNPVGTAQQGLCRVSFKTVHPVQCQAISAVSDVEHPNVLHVQGFLQQPIEIVQLLAVIQAILRPRDESSLTEPAFQHQQLWALATGSSGTSDEGLKVLRQWDKNLQARWRDKLSRTGD
jgi:CheY-like chemotaxis protein